MLIDRYILQRFLANFAVLFALLFVFAAGIDLILNLDEFVKVARRQGGEEAGAIRHLLALTVLMANFQLPRLFLFYGYMHGLVAIGAMAFTLAQMHRHRELVALLASGVSLGRVAMPFVAGVFLISAVQLVNQEFMLHRVAPLLLRGHGEVGQRSVDEFPVDFIDDGRGTLVQAPAFEPLTGTLRGPTILERDEAGRTRRRITADAAVWDAGRSAWVLENGTVTHLPSADEPGEAAVRRLPLEVYPSTLDPRALIIRRYTQYAGMLSMAQIADMLRSPGLVDTSALLRQRYARFAAVAINMLVLFIALPAFLLREPANLMRQSVICAAVAVPALVGGSLGMMLELPGISAAVSVFLPAIVMLPVAIGRWTMLKT